MHLFIYLLNYVFIYALIILFMCLFPHLRIHLYIYSRIYLFTLEFIYLLLIYLRNFTYLLIYLRIYLFFHLFIYVFILFLFVYVFIYVFIYLFIYRFIYLFIQLFTYLLFPLMSLLYMPMVYLTFSLQWHGSKNINPRWLENLHLKSNRAEPQTCKKLNRFILQILRVSACFMIYCSAKHHLDWFLCWSENCTAVSIFAFNTGNTVINWFNVQVLFERFTLFPFNFLSSHESASSPRPLTPLLSALMHAWITGLYLKQLTTRVWLFCIVLQNSKPHYIHYAKLLSLVAEQPWGYLFMFAMGAAICCQGLIAWHGSMCTCGPNPAVHSPCFWCQRQ